MYMRQWKWAEAEAEYRRALDLNPNDAAAHDGFSPTPAVVPWAYGGGAGVGPPRPRFLTLSELPGHTIGWTLFNAHRYDEGKYASSEMF